MPMRYYNPKTRKYQDTPYVPDEWSRDNTFSQGNRANEQPLNISVGGGGGGWIGGALGGAGIGAGIGTAVAPGPGTLIGAGLGALVGGIGAGVAGGAEDEKQKELLDLQKRTLALQEKNSGWDQLNQERSQGLQGLTFLAKMRSDAIQRRNRSLFANDLMRVLK